MASDNSLGACGTLEAMLMGHLACGCSEFVDNSGVLLVIMPGI
jgi:hypothetical protein